MKIFLLNLIILILAGKCREMESVEILSKSRLETCVKSSESDMNCNKKVVVDIAVPSGTSGGEASIVAELVEVEENSSIGMQTIRSPPIITISKSSASPGKFVNVSIPTFEALTQFGTARITSQNIGTLEASYSITFHCIKGVSHTEEQYVIMKPGELITCTFKLYPNTDQAAKYECAAILKDSEFGEIDRAECQFSTTATVLDNGTLIGGSYDEKKNGIKGFFAAVGGFWNSVWRGLGDFFTGKTCRSKCSSFFDFGCHMQYICISWIILFLLLLAIFPSVMVLIWLLHQKGLFDPLYDWWEDRSRPSQHPYDHHTKQTKTRRHDDPLHGKSGGHHQHKRQKKHHMRAPEDEDGTRLRAPSKIHKHKHRARARPANRRVPRRHH